MSEVGVGTKLERENQFKQMSLLTPEAILQAFLEWETKENNNLIEILGVVKPIKGSNTTLPAIIRGLFTKNTKLLALIDAYSTEIVKPECDDKQLFKNFINEFLILIGDDYLVILEKYNTQINCNTSEFVTAKNLGLFAKPILHCAEYVKVIESSIKVIRNPFIIGKLVSIKDSFRQIIMKFENYQSERSLNQISFENIQLFSNKKHSKFDKVSSFFSINDIVERSKNDPLYIVDRLHQTHCELVLLKLSNNIDLNYDSLAILSISSKSDVRSLLFPPFRLNELTIKFDNNRLTLNSIDFSNVSEKHSIIIECTLGSIIQQWVNRLSRIFPLEENNSPLSESFLIESQNKSTGIAGLGINVVTDQDHRKILLSESLPITGRNLHKGPIKLSGDKSQKVTLSSNSANGWDDLVMPIKPSFKERNNSSSSNSSSSPDSIKSQYDRSLNIINKTFSNVPLNSIALKDETGYMKIVGKVYDIDENRVKDRPKSSRAEIKDSDSIGESSPKNISTGNKIADSYSNNNLGKFSSVPDLSKPKKASPLYELSSGSAIDVSNFGKNYTPTFSISHDLSAASKQDELSDLSYKQKKNLFNIFKKQSSRIPDIQDTLNLNTNKTESSNLHNNSIKSDETIQGDPKEKITTSIQQDNTSTSSDDIMEKADKHNSNLPSPFALPSSTSTYFFKQYKNNSSSSVVKDLNKKGTGVIEEDLVIPQALKDKINHDLTIDFFISTSEPKALKISKWKHQHGKWQMLTLNERVFIKLVVNYEENKGWLIAYKEEFDEEYNEDVDKPIILLDLDDSTTSLRNSSAVDLQVSAINSITTQKIQILIRSTSADLTNSIKESINNILGVLTPKTNMSVDLKSSNFTISSSLMDNTQSKSSSTGTSLNSLNDEDNINFKNRIDSMQVILNNPGFSKSILVDKIMIRLQKQLESYDKVNIPSSWSILSMFELTIYLISKGYESYYNFELLPLDDNGQVINFIINEEDRFSKIEKIGKAGLLIKNKHDDIYMIECKGKKELKAVYKSL